MDGMDGDDDDDDGIRWRMKEEKKTAALRILK